jgi:hypothetical protein
MTKKKNLQDFDALMEITNLMHQPGGIDYLFGAIFRGTEPKEKYPYDRLGSGYELRPIEIHNPKGELIINDKEYSHLYHNGLKVSDSVFRKGGTGGKFTDGYCSLIHYVKCKDSNRKDPHGFDFGTHVIINELGEIVLKSTGSLDYPSHCGGNIGRLKDKYYNLNTGEPIMTARSSGDISSKNLLIVEHRYDWYDKSLPLGVYTINKTTCEITKIDDIK